MPKFAQHDSKVTQPAPVIGWYDTDELDYPSLPASSELITLTDAEWDARMDAQWYVQNGALVPKSSALLLSDAQAAQIGKLEAAYAASRQAPVAYMSTAFQADDASQLALTAALSAGSVPAGFFWLDSNNAEIAMDFAQLQGLAGAMLAQRQAAFSKLQARKSAVRAATKMADVLAVVW